MSKLITIGSITKEVIWIKNVYDDAIYRVITAKYLTNHVQRTVGAAWDRTCYLLKEYTLDTLFAGFEWRQRFFLSLFLAVTLNAIWILVCPLYI